MPPIHIKTVNHIAIPIRDRRVSLPFYRDLMGLEVIPSMVDGPAVIWTQAADGTMVHLIEPVKGKSAGYHNAFEVTDFDATVAALRERDLQFAGEPGERYDGQRFVFVLDPDGNRTEFTTPSNLKPHDRICDELGYTRPA